jgi:hypothetical protein
MSPIVLDLITCAAIALFCAGLLACFAFVIGGDIRQARAPRRNRDSRPHRDLREAALREYPEFGGWHAPSAPRLECGFCQICGSTCGRKAFAHGMCPACYQQQMVRPVHIAAITNRRIRL